MHARIPRNGSWPFIARQSNTDCTVGPKWSSTRPDAMVSSSSCGLVDIGEVVCVLATPVVVAVVVASVVDDVPVAIVAEAEIIGDTRLGAGFTSSVLWVFSSIVGSGAAVALDDVASELDRVRFREELACAVCSFFTGITLRGGGELKTVDWWCRQQIEAISRSHLLEKDS
mmetsp:Transcript_15659/g.31926  ORF Transcript_15659/g.31926 Transcript_15659/m.31926 type:complete len:171 (+) Transcript_15659:1644-2156(+)